ncbi:MAG TPA: hypothetical protein VHZ26_08170 [Caulobacteraceae bacterium]|jgi:hypothetical protein|nr:hypothetical protein [Caulobacteraceae bacterium]
MTRSLFSMAAAGLCLVLGAGAVHAAGVRMSPAIQQKLGIKTQALSSTQRASETDAFAKVLDPEPLVQLDSDLATAVAAAEASRAEAARSRALHAADGSIASKDLEAAVAQARSDALKVAMLRNRLSLEWGPGVAHMSGAARAALVRGVVAGKVALVHVDTHNNEGQAGARTVKVDIGDDSVAGVMLGPARAAEPRLQSSGLIVEVTGPDAILLSVGLTNSAHIESKSPQTGYIVPLASIIRYRGLDWAYVRDGPDGFDRRMLQNPVSQKDGFFVSQGVSAGDQVVTEGAAALFNAEQSAPGSAP